MAKRHRDAVTGEFITKEEAMTRKNESIAETVKPRKRSPRQPKPVDKPTAGVEVPESGIPETPQEKAFRMKMDVVYTGKIYLKDNPQELPKESADYLMNEQDWKE